MNQNIKGGNIVSGNFSLGLQRLRNYIESQKYDEKNLKKNITEAIKDPQIHVHNLGVIGHVDHGKSSMCARLCLQNGFVSLREFDNLLVEAEAIGMKSFAYATILDESKEEKQKGVTIGISHKGFLTPKKRFYTMIDCPGHRDYIQNFTKGIGQTELALLVLDINANIDEDLITKQHVIISRASGVDRVIIVLTKIGLVPVEKRAQKINQVAEQVKKFLTSYPVRLDPKNILHVAIDSIEGINLSDKSFNATELPGYDGLSLLEALDEIPMKDANTEEQFIMPIDDAYGGEDSSIRGTACVITGRVIQGKLKVGQEIQIKPTTMSSVKTDVVTGIETHHMKLDQVKAGFNVGMSLRKSEKKDIHPTSVAYSIDANSQPLKLVKQVTVRHAQMVYHPTSLKIGSKLILHTACGPVPAKVIKIADVYSLTKLTKGFKLNLHIPEQYEKYMSEKGEGFAKGETSNVEAKYTIAQLTLELEKPVVVQPVKQDSNERTPNRLSLVFGRDSYYTIFFGTVTDVKYDASELIKK